MKKILTLLFLLFCSMNIFAEPLNVTIEISEVLPNKGQLIIAIYNSQKNYKDNIPFKELKADSSSDVVFINETLPSGDYVVSIFQDKNGNGKLDTRFSIPKEPIGLTNYYRKSIPGGWKKLKVEINKDNNYIKIKMIHFGGK